MQHNMTLHFKQMALNQAPINVVQHATNWCEVYGSGTHEIEQCEVNSNSVYYVGNTQKGGVQQNYDNTYNPSWKNHPNFSWGGNQNQNQSQRVNQYLANSLNLHPQGGLPGDTEPNPKQLHTVSTRNGLQLEEVHINLPLVDILQGIPKYAKYVKDIVASKRRLTKYETLVLTEECSPRIQNRLPKKLKDPGSFPAQITIGQSLGLGSLKRTIVILQLADRSIARPEGVVEDVLVQVGSLIFSIDFVVLDFEPDSEIESCLNLALVDTRRTQVESLDRELGAPPKPSIEESHKLELKTLPTHLRYAYFGTNETLHVILSAELSDL
ncbi:hypothetical protein R3W88_005324 [Solanum pinnatisectum]|uniref:Uncharacterized protein n=1 Tax=Solanum pinnatisectum TaxID=50273 RepID=A0AAV9KC66_9SOLN|nr:hypothetical protein R3W88_005324 [Solanum pinnatisectum]